MFCGLSPPRLLIYAQIGHFLRDKQANTVFILSNLHFLVYLGAFEFGQKGSGSRCVGHSVFDGAYFCVRICENEALLGISRDKVVQYSTERKSGT